MSAPQLLTDALSYELSPQRINDNHWASHDQNMQRFLRQSMGAYKLVSQRSGQQDHKQALRPVAQGRFRLSQYTVASCNPFSILERLICSPGTRSPRARCFRQEYQVPYCPISLERSIGATASYLNILKISSISESPGKSGFLVHISANMQPIDHMSTPVEYCLPPKRISGDLYHKVTTWNESAHHPMP